MYEKLTPLHRAMLRIAWRNIRAEGAARDRERVQGIGADAWAYEVLRDHRGFAYRPRDGAGAPPARRPLEWVCAVADEDQYRHAQALAATTRATELLARRGLLLARPGPYGLGYDLTPEGGALAARLHAVAAPAGTAPHQPPRAGWVPTCSRTHRTRSSSSNGFVRTL